MKSEKGAWDTLIWFAILVMMANQLNAKGMIPWFSQEMAGLVAGTNGLAAMEAYILAWFSSLWGKLLGLW